VHQIAITARHEHYTAQWGVFVAELVPILYDVAADEADVSQAAVTGALSAVKYPSITTSLSSPESMAALDVERVQEEVTEWASWMAGFDTRAAIREYLLQNRDATDRREFVVPAKLPLKLLTAAALAVADGDEGAEALVEEAAVALARFDGPTTAGRLQRLRAAANG